MNIYRVTRKEISTFVILAIGVTLLGCGEKKNAPESQELTQTKVVKKVAEVVKPKVIPDKMALQKLMSNLSNSESQSVARLIKTQVDPAQESEASMAAMPKFFPLTEELKELIAQAENALRMGLTDDQKLAAIEALDGIDSPEILEVILAALNESNAEIREAALDAIMNINDVSVIPAVIKALDDEDPELREYALDALMDVDAPEISEVFMKALDDKNTSVREAAIDTLLFIESPNIIECLSKALNDPNPDIRDMALITIEDIPDKRSVDILIQQGLLNDNDIIREDALDSLEWITDQEFKNYQQARTWWDNNRESFTFDE